MKGLVHSLESFGTVDGPGIRFVVFLSGCPLRCKYCHNPDTWDKNKGKTYESQELVEEILKYKNYYGTSGGVTVSGGEPLLQIDFVIELFQKLKINNIHTACDTSGFMFNPNDEISVKKHQELIKYTDLFLLDIKHIDNLAHKELTNVNNDNVLAFAKFLSDNNKDMWIRHVLVPTINDDELSLKRLKEFISTLKSVKKVELLPYHTMGVEKYKSLCLTYSLEGISPPTQE